MGNKGNVIKKSLLTAVALSFFFTAQVEADTAHFDGIIDYDDLGISFVTLDLAWDNIGNTTDTITFDSSVNTNTIRFALDSYVYTEDSLLPGDFAPVAHFTDGVLDGVFLEFNFDGMDDYFPYVNWSFDYDSTFDVTATENYFSLDDWNLGWIEGYWDVDNGIVNYDPVESSPVPVPGAFWLLGSGLLGLARIRGRRAGQK